MMKRLLPVLLFALLTISGCTQSDQDKIKQTVRLYNEKLPMALKSSSEVLKEVATDREQGRVEIYITQMADENSVVEAELVQLTVKNISVRPLNNKEAEKHRVFPVTKQDEKTKSPFTTYDPLEGKLEAQEVWLYRYLDLKTGKPKGPKQKLGYKTTYILARNDGKWYVADIDFREVKADP